MSPVLMTREQIVAKYGAIDFHSKTWPEQKNWMTMLQVPAGLSNWMVAGSHIPVAHVYCNRDMSQPLLQALNAILKAGIADKLHTYDGCFNIRAVRGAIPAHFSAHSYGLAIDINAATNPMGPSLHTDMSPEFVKCFTDQGFTWGGNFRDRKDPMHFSYCGF